MVSLYENEEPQQNFDNRTNPNYYMDSEVKTLESYKKEEWYVEDDEQTIRSKELKMRQIQALDNENSPLKLKSHFDDKKQDVPWNFYNL